MAVVLVGGTVLFMLLGERLIPDFNHGVLLAILLVTTVLRALYMLNISTTKGYENFRATATIAVIGAPLNLLLILVVWWLDGPKIGRATSELQSLMRISYAVFCLTKKKINVN